MELDQLKSSWNKLNEHLDKKEILDKHALEILVSQCKQKTNGRINKMTEWMKFSTIIGSVAWILIFSVCIIGSSIGGVRPEITNRLFLYAGIFTCFLALGLWWDMKTYLWMKKTKVDEMPVVTVVQRINRFRQWTKYEVIVVFLMMVLFIVTTYFISGVNNKPLWTQMLFLLISVVVPIFVTYYLYKRIIFDNLKEIKKNLDELQELKNN